MADAAAPPADAPKIDLAEVQKGVDLKHVKAEPNQGQDEALAQAALLRAINTQGEIAMPGERTGKVETGLTAAVAYGVTLRTINKQGVIAMPSDHAPKVSNEHLARGYVLHEINKQGVIHVPEGHAPSRDLTPEQLAALLADAKLEKEEQAIAKLPKKFSSDQKDGEWDNSNGFGIRAIRDDKTMVFEVWKAGSREGPHRHSHNDYTILVSGKITVHSLEQDEAGAWKKVVSTSVLDHPGDTLVIPKGTVHSVDYNENTTLIYQQDFNMDPPEFFDEADKLIIPQ